MPCDFIPNTGWVVTKLTFNPLTGQTKEYKIVICCFSAKLAIYKEVRTKIGWL
jgi:hypothetical protein